VTAYLNELDTHLQGKCHLNDSVFDHVVALKIKLGPQELHLKNGNYIHFPALLTCSIWNYQRYIRIVSELKGEFDTRFWLLLVVNLIFNQHVSICLTFTGLTGSPPCLHWPVLGHCPKLLESLQSMFLRSTSLSSPPFSYSPLKPQ